MYRSRRTLAGSSSNHKDQDKDVTKKDDDDDDDDGHPRPIAITRRGDFIFKKPRIIVQPRDSNVPLTLAEEWNNVTANMENDHKVLFGILFAAFVLYGFFDTAGWALRYARGEETPADEALRGHGVQNPAKNPAVIARVLQLYPHIAEELREWNKQAAASGDVSSPPGTTNALLAADMLRDSTRFHRLARIYAPAPDGTVRNVRHGPGAARLAEEVVEELRARRTQ